MQYKVLYILKTFFIKLVSINKSVDNITKKYLIKNGFFPALRF